MTLSRDDSIRLIRSLILTATDEMREMRLNKSDYHVIEKLKVHSPIHEDDLKRKVSIPDSYLDKSMIVLRKIGLIREQDGYIDLEVIK